MKASASVSAPFILTRLPLWPWKDTSILAKLNASLGQSVHHGNDGNAPARPD